jgi:hypothetical protein
MWLPLWLVCLGVTCQEMELRKEILFKTSEECIKFAREAATEFQKEYDRVGYKCVKTIKI